MLTLNGTVSIPHLSASLKTESMFKFIYVFILQLPYK